MKYNILYLIMINKKRFHIVINEKNGLLVLEGTLGSEKNFLCEIFNTLFSNIRKRCCKWTYIQCVYPKVFLSMDN